MKMYSKILLILSIVFGCSNAFSGAPQNLLVSGVDENPEQVVLQRFDLADTDYHHNGLSVIHFPKNAFKPRHQHDGYEVAYVLKGEIHLLLDDGTEKIYREGGSFQISPHVFHVTQAGKQGAVVFATWILK